MSEKNIEIKTYTQALDFIFEFESARDDSLETMRGALKIFGNPQNDFKIIHIAGTNGKGSVSKMLFSILKGAGKKVGVFTSPHLIDIRERFESHTGKITELDFVKYVSLIKEKNIKLAYFEKCFLISQLYFKQQECEYIIVETGVGGTYDTTNIVSPVLTCITSISYDHQGLLGNTIDEIATHKAGIIKAGIPLITNFYNKVIEDIAKSKNAPILFSHEKRETNLLGEYQKENAGLAGELALKLGINNKSIDRGLQNVDHKGRLQKITANILVDGAHNQEGIKQLLKYIEIKKKTILMKYTIALT